MDEKQRKTLMVALDNLLAQRENLANLLVRSNTLREKMYRTEDRPKETSLTCEELPTKPNVQDIVDLFNNVAGEMQVSIEAVRQNINSAIELID